jgi:CubicO group peptidase (beta-lactamase class C family)
MERIQQLLDSFVEKHMAVGTSVLICKDGQEAFYGQAGKRRQGEDTPFDRNTIMLMYSMTKVVTAVAAMTLMDKGIFTPNTPVCEFIPEYKTLQVAQDDGTLQPAATPLTIHHLLTMTSG